VDYLLMASSMFRLNHMFLRISVLFLYERVYSFEQGTVRRDSAICSIPTNILRISILTKEPIQL
jgi:hypothetical protein